MDISALQETIDLLIQSRVTHQLRTTYKPGLRNLDCEDKIRVAKGSPHIWQTFRAPSIRAQEN